MSKQDVDTAYSLNLSATHLLHRAQQAAVTLSSGTLAMKGLTIRQFSVLAALHSEDGQSQSSLVAATGVDRSTLADMVARMEKSGLVKRTVSKLDARAKAVSLSAAGAKAYKAAVVKVEEADELLLKGLRRSKRESFIAALSVLARASEPEARNADKKAKKKSKPEKKKKKKKK